MRVLSLRQVAEEPPGGGGAIATFDAEVAPGIRVNRMTLKRNQSGEFRVFGPRVGPGAVAFFAPAVSIELTALAIAALERQEPYVRHAA